MLIIRAMGLLVLAVLAVLSVTASASSCHEACAEIDSRGIKAKRICRDFRHIAPMPKVYRHCKLGFDQGLHTGCISACESPSSVIVASNFKRQAMAHCQFARDELPRPTVFDACVSGYMRAAEAAGKVALDVFNEDTTEDVAEAALQEALAAAERAEKALKAAKRAEKAALRMGSDDEVFVSDENELEQARKAAEAAYTREEADFDL